MIQNHAESMKITMVGLNRTGHMSVQPGQNRTPKFAGRVLPDRTSTGPILLISAYVWVINSNSKRTLNTNLDSKVQNCGLFEN